jgi:hypothetical protein
VGALLADEDSSRRYGKSPSSQRLAILVTQLSRWGKSTQDLVQTLDDLHGRMATQMFSERVNARLPIDTPVAALLGLLRGQPQPVCGRSCTPGQSNDGASRCVPGAPEAGTSPSPKVHAASDKPKTPATAPQSQPAHERRSADAAAPAVERFVQPASKKAAAYWRSLVRSVDRDLGLY